MMTEAQERQELLNFMRQALKYFDSVADAPVPTGDPAALYSEGLVCLRRLERNDR